MPSGLYRRIDFKRRKDGVPAKVAHIEYDPNRSSYIALLHYADGEKRYILAPARLQVGATVESGERVDIRVGNALPLREHASGTIVHNVELTPGRGGQMAGLGRHRRAAAGQRRGLRDAATAVGRDADGPGRVPRDRRHDRQLRSPERQDRQGGRKRHMGVRPQTRGTAMNPVDHPHGGGEGSTTPGRHPVTPWGVPTLGLSHPQEGQEIRSVHRARTQKG